MNKNCLIVIKYRNQIKNGMKKAKQKQLLHNINEINRKISLQVTF